MVLRRIVPEMPVMAQQELSPEALVDILLISSPHISADGKQIVYSTSPATKAGEHKTSQLHLAVPGKKHSSKPLTSGLYSDTSPKFSPVESAVAFVSDRAKPGESSAIYLVSTTGPGEPYPVTSTEYKKGIGRIEWSPCGQFIAFISTDETSVEQEKKEKDKDDAKVWGQDWEYGRLRVVHVGTKELRTLVSIERHIKDFAWKEDKELVFLSTRTPEIDNGTAEGTTFGVVDLKTGEIEEDVSRFPGSVNTYNGGIVAQGEKVYFLGGLTPSSTCTSMAVWSLDLSAEDPEPALFVEHGKFCFQALRGDNAGAVAASRQFGLRDQIGSVDGSGKFTTLYDSDCTVLAWNFTAETAVLVKSDISQPPEIYSLDLTQKEASLVPISAHNSSVLSSVPNGKLGTGIPILTSHADGTPCSGILILPASGKAQPSPLVVNIHGGPYSRSSKAFSESPRSWEPYLLSCGYAILLPNYRGGSGWGEEYAAAVRAGVGIKDYEDVMVVLRTVLKQYGDQGQGVIDDDNVAVAGWSQGGFLSYLSTVRGTKAGAERAASSSSASATETPSSAEPSLTAPFHFRTAICGAGITDWDLMSMTSDVPVFESELTGSTPWTSPKSNTTSRLGSPIWEMHDAALAVRKASSTTTTTTTTKKTKEASSSSSSSRLFTPVLILHGLLDDRVPVSQAVGFRRGAREYAWPCEMVTYPREPHGIAERAHVLDMLKRVRGVLDRRLR